MPVNPIPRPTQHLCPVVSSHPAESSRNRTLSETQAQQESCQIPAQSQNFTSIKVVKGTVTLELSNMLEYSELIVDGGLARQESRGAHFRTDFPTRDDENWLVHTLAFRTDDGGHELRYKPVTITRFQPEERKY